MSALGDAGSRSGRLGRYELITQIGQGGMAEVQLALQHGPAGFEKLVVVKLVHQSLATQKAFVDMLLDEARVAALVKHPNVVDIYDLGEADGRYFIAMEYLEGEPLLAVLRAGRDGNRLDPLSTARLIADTAEGLDAAHELRSMAGDPIELVHHDVSLGNIVVLYNGQVKLVDFGVAKASQTGGPRNRVQGKFSYMAPEKLRGEMGDRRSDIWSLGVVLWEALVLRRLFKGGNDADTMKQVLEQRVLRPSQINGDVLADFDPIVMRALERDPAARYPTAKAMAQDLEEVLRKQGYGGRNDVIAKYMQRTFAAHIAARKKLLQEVSSKGRASAVRPLPSGGEFSVRVRAPSSELTAEGTPNRRPDSVPPPAQREPTPAQPHATAVRAAALDHAQAPGGDPAQIAAVDDDATVIAPPRRRPHAATIAAGVVIVGALAAVVIALVTGDRGGGRAAQRTPGVIEQPAGEPAFPQQAPPGPTAAVETVEPDETAGAVEPDGTAGTAEEGSPDEPPTIEFTTPEQVGSRARSAPAKDATARTPRHGADKPTAEALYRTGLNAWVRGDARTALASYRKAQQTNPSYAPPWRGVGMIYEKSGDRGAAKAAFLRYLSLAPRAPDAQQIRTRLERL